MFTLILHATLPLGDLPLIGSGGGVRRDVAASLHEKVRLRLSVCPPQIGNTKKAAARTATSIDRNVISIHFHSAKEGWWGKRMPEEEEIKGQRKDRAQT